MSNSTVSKEMFQSVSNISGISSVSRTLQYGTYIYWILGIIFIGAITAVYYYFMKNHTNLQDIEQSILEEDTPTNALDFLQKEDTPENDMHAEDTHAEDTHAKDIHAKEARAKQDETWCFVGEDLSGRYCVKVPSKQSCVPERTFSSMADCSLIDGMHLPAGIQKDGIHFTPLASMNFEKV